MVKQAIEAQKHGGLYNPNLILVPTIMDSGARRQFETGAVRDRGETKPRPDLISPHAQRREGMILALGACKYEKRNWEKGMPIDECLASCQRHIEAWKMGETDEDHLAMARTNLGFILHYEEEIKAGRLPPALNDMPFYAQQDAPKPGTWRTNSVTGQREVYARFSTGAVLQGTPMYKDEALTEPLWPKPFTVYLCGPITGQDIDYEWRDLVTGKLAAHGIKTLNPLRGKPIEDITHCGLGLKGVLADPALADRDHGDIEASDLILAHFPYTPPRQSIGSIWEMGTARALKKPIVLATQEQVFNDHLFCRRFTTLYLTLDEAVQRIITCAMLRTEVKP
jgi:nucleoside 2-deoxyribosyltransferase